VGSGVLQVCWDLTPNGGLEKSLHGVGDEFHRAIVEPAENMQATTLPKYHIHCGVIQLLFRKFDLRKRKLRKSSTQILNTLIACT
jgi:hypothetical protein